MRDLEYLGNAVLSAPVTFISKAVFGKTPYWRQYFWNKWGFPAKELESDLAGKKSIWISAISGGEITQSVSFCRSVRQALQGYKTVLSTESQDAFAFAAGIKMADHIIDPPWDISWPVRRAVKKIHPAAIIHVENAYYPVLLREAKKMGVRNILISARMNDSVLRGQLVSRRARQMRFFEYLDKIGAKTEADKENFIKLGCDGNKISVLGDLRYDLEYLYMNEYERNELKSKLGFLNSDKIFMAGSIHSVEFELVVSAFIKASAKVPDLKMIIAPRWAHEIPDLEWILKGKGLSFRFRKGVPGPKEAKVLILNTFGELARVYGVSDIIYIGNSIIPINERGAGHNIFEALVHGRPIIFGNFMNMWRGIVDEIKNVYPQCEVHSEEEMARAICGLIGDADISARLSSIEKCISSKHSGTVKRYVDFVKENC